MKYLRAVVTTPTRGVIYKRDFPVQNVFGVFVRSFVSNLVGSGLIREHEYYSARVIPRYGQYQAQQPTESAENSTALDHRSWLSLQFEGEVRLDEALSYFTVEVFIVKQLKPYRGTFAVTELSYFWRNVETALKRAGILRYKEQNETLLYACDDEDADFEREEIHLSQRDNTSLVEIIQTKSSTPDFPRKALADFHIEETQRLERGRLVRDTQWRLDASAPGVHILITRPALENLQRIASSDVRVEQGGVLVGSIYETPELAQYLVVITDDIPAEGAQASAVELHYTFHSWQRQTALLKERYPTKRIVGWYHTHLVKKIMHTPEVPENSYATELFFSEDDFFTHRQFFRDKWYVAMVLDPAGNLIFYRWVGNEIESHKHFHIISHEEG